MRHVLINFLLIACIFCFDISYIDSISGQRRDGSKLYDIYYEISDLESTDSIYIQPFAFRQSGDSLSIVSFEESSDTGFVISTGIKHIIWKIGEDIPDVEFYSDSIYIRILASRPGYSPDDCFANGFCMTFSDIADNIPFAIEGIDDGYYIGVSRQLTSTDPAHIAIIETDSSGIDDFSFTIALENSISNPSSKYEEGRYWISGISIFDTSTARDVFITQIDSSYEPVFSYSYFDSINPSSEELALDIEIVSDIYISGQYAISEDSASSIMLAKLDRAGAILWAFSLGGSGHDEFGKVAYSNSDEALYVSGHTSGFHGSGISCLVVKIDTSGSTLWARNIYSEDIIFSDDICASTDGGCVLLAHRPSSFEIIVIKLSDDGEIIWQKAIGGDFLNDPYRIENSEPANYTISAYSRVIFDSERHSYIFSIDWDGNLIWQKLYNHDAASTTCRDIFQNSDGSMIAVSSYQTSVGLSENILLSKSSTIPLDYFCCMFDPGFTIYEISLSMANVEVDANEINFRRIARRIEISNTDYYPLILCE